MRNFQLVALASCGPLTFICEGCGKRVRQDVEPVFADLNGRAFRDYFCNRCTEARQTREEPR